MTNINGITSKDIRTYTEILTRANNDQLSKLTDETIKHHNRRYTDKYQLKKG